MDLIKVAKLGSAVKEVALDTGSNIGAALAAAEVDAGGFEVRLNGNPATTTTPVRSGDIVTLIPQIKGGK
jgi:sulfur carrier protein ThiS